VQPTLRHPTRKTLRCLITLNLQSLLDVPDANDVAGSGYNLRQLQTTFREGVVGIHLRIFA